MYINGNALLICVQRTVVLISDQLLFPTAISTNQTKFKFLKNSREVNSDFTGQN